MKRITLTLSDTEFEAVRELAESRFPGLSVSVAAKVALLLQANDRERQRTTENNSERQRTTENDREPEQHAQGNARARGSSSGSGSEKEKDIYTSKPKTAPAGKRQSRLAPVDVSTRIVEDLNQRAGTKYRAKGKRVRQLIAARLAEGYTESDFRTVHRKKCGEWLGSEMARYLRPETLYSPKFEQYVGQLEAKQEKPPEPRKAGLYIDGEGWHHYEGNRLVAGEQPPRKGQGYPGAENVAQRALSVLLRGNSDGGEN